MKCNCCNGELASPSGSSLCGVTADKALLRYCAECQFHLLIAMISTRTRDQMRPYEKKVQAMRDE